METNIRCVTPVRWILHRKQLLAFAARYGDGRVDEAVLRQLAELDPILLGRPDRSGAGAAVAKTKGRVTGMAAAIGRGRDAFAVVVHPSLRRLGIGTRLTRALLEMIGTLDCRLPADDARAAAMCMRAGLQPVDDPGEGPDGIVRLQGCIVPPSARMGE